MAKPKDLTGKRFGRLVARKPLGKIKGGANNYWLCDCDCGNETKVSVSNLGCGNVISCGCAQKEAITKHGEHSTRLYHCWENIMSRCGIWKCSCNKTKGNYIGRGISVCKEWKNYIDFRNWALANGYQKNLTIDRIDNEGNYEPTNCRWATRKEQARNTRFNKLETYNNETHCIAEWAEILNINVNTLRKRLFRGMSFEQAIGAT
jgi:hypothetical protein